MQARMPVCVHQRPYIYIEDITIHETIHESIHETIHRLMAMSGSRVMPLPQMHHTRNAHSVSLALCVIIHGLVSLHSGSLVAGFCAISTAQTVTPRCQLRSCASSKSCSANCSWRVGS